MEGHRPDRRTGVRAGHPLPEVPHRQLRAAEVAKQKAKNEQETAKVEAETKRIKAQGEADANKVLNDSLTDNVLRQHYIDALKNADQLIVTPEGSNTLIQPR